MFKKFWDWLMSLFATSAPTPTPVPVPTPIKPIPTPVAVTLKKGDKGDAVKTLQLKLIQLGYFDGPADGNFELSTETAVETFQATVALSADGIVGPLTQAALAVAQPVAPNPGPKPSGGPLRGIDTSHYEPGVNWVEVAKTCPFSITKATEGLTGVDSLFKTYWAQMKAAGIIRGAYHFFHPNLDPVAQAKHFLSVVGTLEENDFVILDFEATGGLSGSAQTAAALQWLQIVQAGTGKIPMIYASPSFINEMGNPIAFAKYPFWVANYGVAKPHIPKPWTSYVIWQDSDHGKIEGVPNPVDTNWFNGSSADLLAFVQKKA